MYANNAYFGPGLWARTSVNAREVQAQMTKTYKDSESNGGSWHINGPDAACGISEVKSQRPSWMLI